MNFVFTKMGIFDDGIVFLQIYRLVKFSQCMCCTEGCILCNQRNLSGFLRGCILHKEFLLLLMIMIVISVSFLNHIDGVFLRILIVTILEKSLLIV